VVTDFAGTPTTATSTFRSRRAGDRVMTSVSRYLTQQLRLKVNEAKSAVARPEERKFLGFSISNDGSERRIAPKALDKFKAKIRDLTCRTRGLSLQQIVDDLVPYLLGWRGYSASARPPACSRIWKRGSADDYGCIFGGSGRMDQIASKNSAAAASPSSTQRSPQAPPTGFWRMSGHPAVQQALRNHAFDSLGLPRLYVHRQA